MTATAPDAIQTPTTTTPVGASSGERPPFAIGLLIALISAATFGSSGPFAASLLATGWSPGAIVLARIGGAALVLLIPTVLALRGRWGLVRRNAGLLLAYGLVAVAGCQLAFFAAVDRLSVGVALLLEYLAPVLIVGWLWARHGHRPSRLTVVGVALAVIGLALVLDVFAGLTVDLVGVGFGLLAALGLMTFFLLSSRSGDALPPMALAGGGLVVGAVGLAVTAVIGVLPVAVSTEPVVLAGQSAPWWLSIGELIVVAAALAYVTGIAAARALGAKVASFVGLSEVLFAILFAWILVAQLPAPIQLLGGALIVGGVIAVRLGEESADGPNPAETGPAGSGDSEYAAG